MKIFSDKHNQSLTNSLRMLFEDRLGYELYFPFGMEWYPDFWDLQPFEVTARQYLLPNSKPFAHTPSLTIPLSEEDGIFQIESYDGTPPTKGITLERFKKETFDIIIASVPQHVEKFIKLRDLYQPQAKLIFQVGNAWTFDNSFPIKNILASAKIPSLSGFNTIEYHQEVPLDVFSYEPPREGKKIYSFINCLNVVELYKKDWELFLELERLMPEWEFKSFGGLCRDGGFGDIKDVAEKMKEATFIIHCKSMGDGFGHTIHQAAAVGRPLITRYSDYVGKLAEPLIASTSAILVDGKTPQQISDEIQASTRYLMGQDIYRRFKQTVDFDKEELAIKDFLSKLK